MVVTGISYRVVIGLLSEQAAVTSRRDTPTVLSFLFMVYSFQNSIFHEARPEADDGQAIEQGAGIPIVLMKDDFSFGVQAKVGESLGGDGLIGGGTGDEVHGPAAVVVVAGALGCSNIEVTGEGGFGHGDEVVFDGIDPFDEVVGVGEEGVVGIEGADAGGNLLSVVLGIEGVETLEGFGFDS